MNGNLPCNHEIDTNMLINAPFEMWGRGACLLCGENKPTHINDSDGRFAIDKWLRTVD